MSLFLLSVVGTFSFGIINEKITYLSTYSSLCYSITFFTLSIILLITYNRFKINYLYHLFYLSIITTLYFIRNSIKIESITIIGIISLLLLIINIIKDKEDILYSISKLSSYLMIPLIIKFYNTTPILVSITCLINIINIIYLLFKEKESFQLIKLLLIDLLIILGISRFNLEINNTIFLLFITITILVTILKWLNTSSIIKEIHYIMYSFLTLILLFILEDNNETILIISLIFLLENILQSITINNNSLKISKYIEPISIIVSLCALFSLDYFYNKLLLSEILFLAVVIFSIINFFIKEEKRNNIYYISTIIGIIIGIIITLSNNEGISSLLYVLASTYIFFYTKESKERFKNIFLYISYILLLITITTSIIVINVFNLPLFLTCILLIGILILISTITNNKIIKQISLFYISIPLFYLLKSFNEQEIYINIIESIIVLYLTFLITKFFCKTTELKSALSIIGIIYSLRIVFFIPDIIIAIYIATVGLIITIIGFYKKEMLYFFPLGIGIMIADIIYQLKDIWKSIPFYFYLLIIGLGIITFVTIKQLKKTK